MNDYYLVAIYRSQIDGAPTDYFDISTRFVQASSEEDARRIIESEEEYCSYDNTYGQKVSWELVGVVSVDEAVDVSSGDEVTGFTAFGAELRELFCDVAPDSLPEPAGPIRRATDDDAEGLARLISPLGYPVTEGDILSQWATWSEQGNVALVVPDGESLLGVVTLHSTHVLHRPYPVGRITSLAVDPSAQGRGLGRALIVAAEREMKSQGCHMLEITSHMRRAEAHTFYEHVGFEKTSFRFMKDLLPQAPVGDGRSTGSVQ